jgi:hypothetical protein
MPQRSTPFQAIVRLVREHLAGPGVTVTESKFLRDAVLGIDREVDIVIEGAFDDEPIVVSIEVRERSRPADIGWVQEMLQKHRDLPTNKLLLVSRTGFSGTALAAVDREAGRVQALTPEVIEIDDEPVVTRFYLDAITYKATGCHLYILTADGHVVENSAGDVEIYDVNGASLGPLAVLVHEAIHLPPLAQRFSIEAHNHSEREQVKSFTLGLNISRLGYFVKHLKSGELHLIEELRPWGDFKWEQVEIPLALTRLGQRTYGAAQASIAGRSVVWVATTDEARQLTTLSWQTTDASGPARPQGDLAVPETFPGLLTLSLPSSPTALPSESVGGESPGEMAGE